MARLMVSFGMLPARALSTAARRRGFPAGSPPERAETVISLSSLVQPFDFFASEAALVCLILDHRLWPDMRDRLSRGPLSRKEGRSILARVRAVLCALVAFAACTEQELQLPPARPRLEPEADTGPPP